MSGAARATRRPVRTLRASLAAVLALTLWAGAHATTYLALTPMQMLDKADLAFAGTVSSVSVTVRDGRPWTDVGFEVTAPLKGVATDATGKAKGPVTLSFLGGDAPGGPSLTVGGMPHFENGERVLIFAYRQAYASPIVGFRQALWRVTAAGVVDEEGRPLSVDGDGNLVTGGSGATLQQIVDAIDKHLGRTAATP